MLVKFQQEIVIYEIVYTLAFKATYTANDSDKNLFKTLIVISEDGRFISSKSGVDPSWNNGAKCVPEKCRQTDGQTAFRLYVIFNIAMCRSVSDKAICT